ncbi:NADPH-dependent F420 reductase [Occultella kanbiaonis]|uniref:NADPH-dependent F420 reductase n=1 Tax=Occultella kanbiaonis TaxID=2675754 RepID=UPI0012B8BB40|nr:NAD(P)-binding domain-containing protein [Occultella kanbiaonis]
MTEATLAPPAAVRIGILGAGNIARTLGGRWAARGHTVVIGGRSLANAQNLASDIGHRATAASPADAVAGADVVLVAVPWSAVDDVLAQVRAGDHALSGVTLIDPTNPVGHGVGRHRLATGSAAEHIASRAPGARVVKAFNVHPASRWDGAGPDDVVTIAGDDPSALADVIRLVRDVGATPHVLGGLDRARQVEEFAGTVIALAFAGVDPRSAVPAF